jgi:polyisoprenoid-binding protein YceI
MRGYIVRTAIVTLMAMAISASARAAAWEIDSAHSSAQFAVKHMMVSNVRGEFSKVTGTVDYDGKDITKMSVQASIDVNTIDTREPNRDQHLKSEDFFDVAKYPTITFKSKRAESAGSGKFRLIGDLTMHGVTREVVLDVEGPSAEVKDKRGNLRMGASATTKVNRKDFGLKWNALLETGGAVVGDEVTITIDLEMVQKLPPAGAEK